MQPDWAEHAVSIVVIAGSVIVLLVTIAAGLVRQVFNQLLDAINQFSLCVGIYGYRIACNFHNILSFQ